MKRIGPLDREITISEYYTTLPTYTINSVKRTLPLALVAASRTILVLNRGGNILKQVRHRNLDPRRLRFTSCSLMTKQNARFIHLVYGPDIPRMKAMCLKN